MNIIKSFTEFINEAIDKKSGVVTAHIQQFNKWKDYEKGKVKIDDMYKDIKENEMGSPATTLNTPGMGNVVFPEPIVRNPDDDDDDDEEELEAKRMHKTNLKNLKTFEE